MQSKLNPRPAPRRCSARPLTLAVLLTSAALFLRAPLALATTDTEIGNPGTMGTSGAVNTDQNGQPGGPGQSVTADAGVTIPNIDPSNTATAYGGQGGSGGNGGGTISGLGAGAAGGLGGNATAQSSTLIAIGDGSATSYAQGGTGGFGGSGGQFFQYGLTGAGSIGGNATASAFATGPADITVNATAGGGPGGQPGVGSNTLAGVTGGTASLTAGGTSTGGGNVTVIGTLRAAGGGQAGGGFGPINGIGVNGGNGIDGSLNNAVSGSTTGTLTLEQIVYGGGGGTPIGQPSGESAGAATSGLSYSGVTAAVVNAYSIANGGGGAGALENAGGGDGNIANASISISGIGAINVTANATGGSGGGASGTFINGTTESYQAGNGTVGTAIASGTSTTGQAVTVTANQTGGTGGTGYTNSNPGNGADSVMNNAVSGASAGSLTLIQQATAGNGGLSEGGLAGVAGNAGNAVSNLTVNQSTEIGGINVQSVANGGQGGFGWEYNGDVDNGTPGSTASASINVTDIGDITASVTAAGGSGGGIAVGAGNSANGGTATITGASATSTGLGAHTVTLTVTENGGNGGSEDPPGGPGSFPPIPGSAGNGIDASLINVANPNVGASGTINVTQEATGGNAGQLYQSGTGSSGTAGAATAELNLSRNVASMTVTDNATGGLGGDSNVTTNPGTPGGLATATSVATDNTGTPNAVASAQGGEGGGAYNAQDVFISQPEGLAIASATANSTLAGAYPTANATASGHNPQATATVNTAAGGGSAQATVEITSPGDIGTAQANISSNGLLIAAHANASSTETGDDFGEAQTDAFVTGAAPGFSSVGSLTTAAGILDALPAASQASLAIGASHPNTAAAIGANTDWLGISVLSDLHSIAAFGPVAGAETQTSDTDYVFDLADLPNGTRQLLVALLDPQVSGNGFTSLEFKIQANGTTIPGQDYTFSSPSTAATFFSDDVLNLGPIINLSSGGQLDLDFILSVTTQNPGDGFAADFLVANTGASATPEPAGALGLLLGLAALRRRKSSSTLPVR